MSAEIKAIGDGVEQRAKGSVALVEQPRRLLGALRLMVALASGGFLLVQRDALGDARLARVFLRRLQVALKLGDTRLDIFQPRRP